MSRLLLCPPDYYGIEYEINPWMHRARQAEREVARAQWTSLRDTLQALGCRIDLLPAQPGLPDLVFTANAGLAVGGRVVLSSFRHKERRGEEAHFERWFAASGFEVLRLPPNLVFEGEGDALFGRDVLFCGYRFRSDIRAHHFLAELLNILVISVELRDARFYHLDTCFCPLPDGTVMWYPEAFDEYSQRAIREHSSGLIEAPPEEAAQFACNAVALDRHIILPTGCPELCRALTDRGYHTHELPMSEFIKAGGACKCLTLFLPARERAGPARSGRRPPA